MVHLAEQIARDFDFSTDKIYLNVWISVGAAAGSGALCLFVLAAAAWIYSKPWARHTIDRVSFRLFLWSMLFELFYDFAFIAVGVESAVPGASHSACATGVYFMMSTLGVVNYLCTCIALNLMLFVCFNINPLEQKLERWYLAVSLVLGMGVPIVPAILGHFGADPLLNVCWIQAKDDTTRMKYFVLDLYLWQALSCVVATLAVIATLFSLVRQRRRIASNTVDLQKPRLSIDTEAGQSTHEWQLQLQTKFTTIACLISLYPITLIVVNGFLTVGDLYMSAVGGVKSESVYALYCIYYFLYGGRGIFFALLGIFVDPCLRRGLKTVWRGNKDGALLKARGQVKPPREASLLEILGPAPELAYDTHGESSLFSDDKTLAAQDSTHRGSKSSIELSAALNRLPLEVPMSNSPSLSLGPAVGAHSKGPEAFTRSFSGVPKGKLPEGLSDDVDITRQRVHDPYLSWTKEDRVVEEQVLLELEPLDPDLPDAVEEKQRRRKAALLDREEAMRAFEETQAQL